MNQKHLLVEHLSNIDSVINQPLQFTQRIKFTCFDVSQNYVVFGATSGGLYVFNRYPHAFLKLIPSKQGSVVQVSISPTEKTIALANSRGLVVIIQNCFLETNVQYQVYSEHEGNLVTAIKWHSDDVYCGDNRGKVSVITLPNLLTKAIFQTPCASLMQLESSIVQIDCYSKLLLISTYTRTYICDTDKEQYRQIGKKLRDGHFGACFLAKDNSEIATAQVSRSRGLFKNVKDDEQFQANINDNVKIFCARPGARMWEAKLDASVTRTHQFKNYLKREPTSVIHLNNSPDTHLNIINFPDFESSPSTTELFNFSKVFLLGNKFIFTFNKEGFYVFEPETIAFICWCNYFKNIKDVRVVGNFMYIWNENVQVHVMALYDLEKIILKTLIDKQYYICSELCVKYMEDIVGLVETSEKIHLVSILKEKLTELQADELLQNLSALFKAIKEFSDKKCSGQRLATGIVVVNNRYTDKDAIFDEAVQSKYEKNQALPSLKEISFNVTDKLTVGTKNLKEKLQILEATVKNLTLNDVTTFSKVETVNSDVKNQYFNVLESINDAAEENDDSESIVESKIQPQLVEPVAEIDSNLIILYQQYELNKINYNMEIPKFNKLLLENNLSMLADLFHDFKLYMLEKNVDQTNINFWCYRNYLKHFSNVDFETEIGKLEIKDRAMSYLLEAFRAINFSPQHSCVCLFPLPSARTKVPDYYNVGCTILKKLLSVKRTLFEEFHKDIPFMWKYIIEEWRCNDDTNTLLPLLIQFGDEHLIETFLNKFKYDIWDNAVQLLLKLKKNTCINCDNKFEKNCDVISWTKFATLIVQSIGGPSTIKLLTRYANFIPSNELDSNFYQSCIFATATDNFHEGLRSEAINFSKTLQSDEAAAMEFDKTMVAFLQKSAKKPVKLSKNSLLNGEKTDSKCSFCDLPIEIPLLSSDVKLKCDHFMHTICLNYNKGICNVCKE